MTGGGAGGSSSCISSMFSPNMCPKGRALAGISGGLASSHISKRQPVRVYDLILDCLCRLLTR